MHLNNYAYLKPMFDMIKIHSDGGIAELVTTRAEISIYIAIQILVGICWFKTMTFLLVS